METIIHKEIDSLEKLIPKWAKLKDEFHEITIFQDINWLKSWWEIKSKQIKITPYIIEIKDCNKTIGIIPFFRSFKKIAGFNFRILKPMGIEQSDYLLPILSKEYSPNNLLKIAFKKLYRDKSSWDYIEWADLPENSFFDSFLTEHLGKSSLIERQRTHNCPIILIDNDFDTVKLRFNRRILKEILKKENKLNSEGKLIYSKVRIVEEIEPLMNRFFELHCERWVNTDSPSIFAQIEEREHAMLAAKNLFKSSLLHLTYISFNDDIMVINFGMSDGKRSYLYQHAINSKYQKYSPGGILVYYLVLEACSERLEIVDFLRGDEGYKQKWGTTDKYNVRYVLFNRSLKSLMFKMIYNAYNSKHLKLYNQNFIKKWLLAMTAKNEV